MQNWYAQIICNNNGSLTTEFVKNENEKIKRLNMDLNIEKNTYDAIAQEIHSDTSPVGIDAKKTHILILEKLMQLEKKLDRIEAKINKH